MTNLLQLPFHKRSAICLIFSILGIQCANHALSFSPRRLLTSGYFGPCHTSLNSLMSEGSSDVKCEVVESEWDWEATARSVFTGSDTRPVILFDGVCNLCNGGVNFALDRDPVGNFRFASLQSKIGQSLLLRSNRSADDISSIVLVDADTAYFKSEAVLRITKKLDGLLPVMGSGGFFVPRFIRNIVYDFVADNRYRLGKREDSCRLEDEQFDDRFIPDP